MESNFLFILKYIKLFKLALGRIYHECKKLKLIKFNRFCRAIMNKRIVILELDRNGEFVKKIKLWNKKMNTLFIIKTLSQSFIYLFLYIRNIKFVIYTQNSENMKIIRNNLFLRKKNSIFLHFTRFCMWIIFICGWFCL